MKTTFIAAFLFAFAWVSSAQSLTEQQYDSLKTAWLQGKKEYADAPLLAIAARNLKEKDFAEKVAQDYFKNYLPKLNEKQMLNRKVIEMINGFNRSANEGFRLFYKYPGSVDSVMQEPGFAKRYIDFIVTHTEIDPYLIKDDKPVTQNPAWEKIESGIAKKYNKPLAERLVLDSKIRWYEFFKDTTALIDVYQQRYERFGIDTSFYGRSVVNNAAYYIYFEYCNDQVALKKAAGWLEQILKLDSSGAYIDTYACLLYKLGKKEEALKWEAKAVEKDSRNKELVDNYEKMKRGEKNWYR